MAAKMSDWIVWIFSICVQTMERLAAFSGLSYNIPADSVRFSLKRNEVTYQWVCLKEIDYLRNPAVGGHCILDDLGYLYV